MDDPTEKLRTRLQTLQKQAQQDRESLQSHAPNADAIYAKLIDSLTTTLHNLPAVAEKRFT